MFTGYFIQKLEEGVGKLRRFYLVHFRGDYVRTQLELRRGECNRCGDCCSIMFKCPHLDGDNNCTVYECRYKQCAVFPIEPWDLKFLRHRCSYYFDGEEPPNLPDAQEARNIAGTNNATAHH